MAMKNGDESKQNEKQLSTEEKLLKVVTDLQNKITELEKKQSVQQQSANAGISGVDLEKILERITAKQKDIDYEEGIDESQIPKEDFLPEGVRFCCPRIGYFLVDDKRQGHRVTLPWGKKRIEFKYASTRRVNQGKYEALAPYCVYTSKSVKEVEWIRNHSLYGTMFYESSTEAATADMLMVARLATVMGILKNYELPDLIARCNEQGVKPNEDPRITRINLAKKIVENEMALEKEATSGAVMETFKNIELLNASRSSKE